MQGRPQPAPDVTPSTGGPGTLYRIFAPDVRPQFTKQWNIFVERKLTDALSGQVGYVGSRSSHMVVPFDFNQPQPDPGPVSTWRPLEQRRPLFQLNHDLDTATSGTNSIGVGKYDALQASLRQRPVEGLEFLASYTFGKALSDNIGYYGVGWGQTAVQGFYYMDSSDPLRDYGPSPYDVRHMFSVAANYELPFGKGKKYDLSGPADVAFGGWHLNTIFQARTGLALTVYDSAGQSFRPHVRSSGRIAVQGRHGRVGPERCMARHQLGAHAAQARSAIPASASCRPVRNADFGKQDITSARHARRSRSSVQRLQSSELRFSGRPTCPVRQLRENPQHLLSAAHRRTGIKFTY